MHRNLLFAIGVVSMSCCVCIAQGGGKVLKDMGGNVISIHKGGAEVVNHQTGEPADGSETARKIRPGVIELFEADLGTVIQTDEQGDALPAGEPSLLVSHLDALASDGVLYFSGETVPKSAMLNHGILKNPGPDTVHATRPLRWSVRTGRNQSRRRGRGELLGVRRYARLSELFDSLRLRMQGRRACSGNHLLLRRVARRRNRRILVCDCSNADDFTCDVDINDDGIDDITDGDVANCKTKVVNN